MANVVDTADEADVMETHDESIQLSPGLQEILDGASGELSKCELTIATLFDVNQKKLRTNAVNVLDLTCLEGLNQAFLPENVFVRSEMQAVFSRILTKVHPSEERKILTGSAGIGKSVVFLLAALCYQLLHPQKKVAYIRKVEGEKGIGFLLMEPGRQPFTLNVVFSGAIDKGEHETLFGMWKEFRSYTKKLKPPDYVKFVDGPKHDATLDILNKSYDYFCTSGGYPPKKQDEILSTDVTIMSGWKEATILEALTTLKGMTQDKAETIYAVSGGRIRLALWGSDSAGIGLIKKFYEDLITDSGQEKIALALTKSDSSASMNSSDRLRTRFLDYDGKGMSLLIVDSFYAMSKLRAQLDFADFMSSYHLAEVCGLHSARGWFFEEIMHLWFKNSDTHLISKWIRTDGTAVEGVRKLDQKNLYWIPATSNFANIDAAFVCGSILVCLQYTVRKHHRFDSVTFWTDFAGKVLKRVPFSSVVVWFVSPKDTFFETTPTPYQQHFSGTDAALRRSQGELPSIQVSFESAEVNCNNVDTLNATVPSLGFFQYES